MDTLFYPPRHIFNNDFDDKLEKQHEELKRIATINHHINEVEETSTIEKIQEPIPIKPKRKTKKDIRP